MAAANLSKDFFELVKAIGESKSKQEEDRIIQDEVRALKQIFADMRGGPANAKRMRELLVRLIYVEMLGHDASWGYVVAVQQTATTNLPQKRAGYLACSLMLHPAHDFRFMLVNQLQRDLGSANVLETCASLVAMCKLVTLEMVPALLPRVAEQLTSSEHTLVRKKAVMALHRFYQLDPHSVQHLRGPVKALVRDRDPSVMASALCLLHEFAKEDTHSQLDLVDQYCSILKQITEHRLPREFDYHRMPAPWIQIKLLKILALLGKGNMQASESMYEILGECIKRADSGTNVGFAVAYECVKTIAAIWPCEWLLDLAASTISRFIQSDQYNLKFLGVTGLASVVRTNAKYAQQHQLAVIDCLEDPDESLKRITLELLFRMTNAHNVEPVVQKLEHFLHQARDPFLRRDLVDRITQLADGFAPNPLWFVTTMIGLLNEEHVAPDAVHSLLKLIAEEEEGEVRQRACDMFALALRQPKSSGVMLASAFWVLGEFAQEEEGGGVLDEVCALLAKNGQMMSVPARLYGVSAVGKLVARLGRVPDKTRRFLERQLRSGSPPQVQQRCGEILELFKLSNAAELVPQVLPEDASCEDFDPVEFAFLDEFCSILRTAGANEYQPRLKVTGDYYANEDELFASAAVSPGPGAATAANAQGATLRFSAYEAPSLAFQQPVVAPAPAASVFSPPQSAAAALPQQPKVKSVWGPTGYAGNLPQQQQQVAAMSTHQAARAAVATKPAPSQQYDFGGEYERDGDAAPAAPVASRQPVQQPQQPPKPKELTEKEKAAMALFGGGGAPAMSTASPAKPRAPAPVQHQQQQQPVADLLSLDDAFASAPAPAASSSHDLMALMEPVAPAPAPPKKPAVAIDSIMDLFGTPPPPVASRPLQQPQPAAATPKPLSPLAAMTTPEFGQLWGAHPCEQRVSVVRTTGGSLQQFLTARVTARLGCSLVELIPATQEAILAGKSVTASQTVLLHAKDRGDAGQHVDFLVRSQSAHLTQLVADELARAG